MIVAEIAALVVKSEQRSETRLAAFSEDGDVAHSGEDYVGRVSMSKRFTPS